MDKVLIIIQGYPLDYGVTDSRIVAIYPVGQLGPAIAYMGKIAASHEDMGYKRKGMLRVGHHAGDGFEYKLETECNDRWVGMRKVPFPFKADLDQIF